MTAEAVMGPEDLVPVRSRISWSAILGGSVLALALYFLLGLLGVATGLSVTGNVDAQSIKVGSAVYAVFITALCLFVGGFYASRFTAGEDGVEAAAYGIIVWAVVLGTLVCLVSTGVSTGLNAVTGLATVGGAATPDTNWEEAARRAGITQDRINEWKQQVQNVPGAVRQSVENPQNQQAALDATRRATWYSFIGAWLSMMTAALGGYVGGGPTGRLLSVVVSRKAAVTPVAVASRN